MAFSWRNRQKTFFAESSIEFEQDQRIIDWLNTSKLTWIHGENYFNNKLDLTKDTKNAEQALLFIKTSMNIKTVEYLCKSLVDIPRVCIAINKFAIYTNEFNDVSDDYNQALFEFIQPIFKNRKIDYYYLSKDDGTYFNYASPTTQFFIT
jgi:hypothetical protein